MTNKKNIATVIWVVAAIIVFAIGCVFVYNIMPDNEEEPTITPVADESSVEDDSSVPEVTVPPITTTTTSPTVITEPTTTSVSVDENGDEWQIQTNAPATVTSAPITELLDTSSLYEEMFGEVTTVPTTVTTTTTTTTAQLMDKNGLPLNPVDGQEAVNKDGELLWYDMFEDAWKPVGNGMNALTNSPEDQEWIEAGDQNIKYGE